MFGKRNVIRSGMRHAMFNWWLLALAVAIFGTGGLIKYIDMARAQQLNDAAATIQTAVERYAVDHQGCYPPDLQTLVNEGLLDALPDNPYARGTLVQLTPGQEPVAGGVIYLPDGPLIAASQDGEEACPRFAHREYDDYVLVFYGNSKSKTGITPEGGTHGKTVRGIYIDSARIVLGSGQQYGETGYAAAPSQ